MATEGDVITIKEHSKKKYNIIRKYAFQACAVFANKYHNFVYVDTHGGSGKIILPDGNIGDGSVLIFQNAVPNFPIHVVEIDTGRYSRLVESTESFSNIKTYYGDCNSLIQDILKNIPSGNFFLCLIDPDGLIYRSGDKISHQLLNRTVIEIGNMKKSEILLNFPLEAIQRCGACLGKEDKGLRKNVEHVAQFYGEDCNSGCALFGKCNNGGEKCGEWEKIITESNTKKRIRNLLELYIDKNLSKYQYVGAILIKNQLNVPQYYMIFGTHHPVGAKIMRDIMRIEWSQGQKALIDWKTLYKTKYPLERFIFD